MRAVILALSATLAACGGGEDPVQPTIEAPEAVVEAPVADALHMYVFDCGTLEVSDLDIFSTAGDYAGVTDTLTDTCYLIRHPDGDMMWDLGLPGILAGAEPQTDGVFTVSLDQTLTDQLNAVGLFPSDVEYVSISHSHFDHIGQIDQLPSATWLVHEDEYAAMFPPNAGSDEDVDLNAAQFLAFDGLETIPFSGDYDVFGDGSVVIFETPGHTPGHTSLQVDLPETGVVFLTGDLYHRAESRELQRIPRFNADEAMTKASMEAFEARAAELGAKVIIQHEPASIDPLPKPPEALR
ncbi:MAG: N-acyl homoserine lactonase family protein [Pseudomonadota bacterium]